MTPDERAALREMLTDARAATLYSYEAGQYPDELDPVVGAWIAGDGGLLNALDLILRLLDALDAETARADVNSRLRQSMEAAGTRYQAERRSALEAAGLYLGRARTAEAERDEARAEVERLRNIVGETGPQCSRCGHQEGKHYYGDRGPDGCRECNGDHTFTPTDGGEVAQALLGVVLGVVCFVMLLWRLSS